MKIIKDRIRIMQLKYMLIVLVRQIQFHLTHPNFIWLSLSYFLKWKEIVFLPISIDIEPNNNCNFRCSHCQVTHWDKKITHLDEKSFNKILTQLPGLRVIKLQGMGEPLLNKELLNMLKSGEARGISMQIVSNASLCNRQAAEQLAQLKKTAITFSIDGATKETFEKIRAGSNFEDVKKNISSLVQLRGGRKQPRISIWSVITKDNIAEIAALIKLTKELGVDSIALQPFLNNWGKEEMEQYTNLVKIDMNDKYITAKISEVKAIAQENQIHLDIYYGNFCSRRQPCLWPWTSAYIASNGDVIPCCTIGDSDTIKMGNVFEKSFSEIWYSAKYHDFRTQIRKHDLPSYCKNCYAS